MNISRPRMPQHTPRRLLDSLPDPTLVKSTALAKTADGPFRTIRVKHLNYL